MKLEELLEQRSAGKCELCKSEGALSLYEVPHAPYRDADCTAMICGKCLAQLNKKEELDSKHWACLKESMWSEVPGIQVVSWRMLNRLREESWAVEQLDMMYLDDDIMEWARATGDHELGSGVDLHKDSNGAVLQDGDSVVLTKSLDVKGSTLNAKMGTVVKNIKLVNDNTEQIEGRVEGQLIVILTKYVRKQGS
jgi:protein PhnA